MFYLEEHTGSVSNYLKKSNDSSIEELKRIESDGFLFDIGQIVYRVTDTLFFKKFKVMERWYGSTMRFFRLKESGRRKCYKVEQIMIGKCLYPQNQYETALFKTKEEAFKNRHKIEVERYAKTGIKSRFDRFLELEKLHLK